jgi:hypothetical protein
MYNFQRRFFIHISNYFISGQQASPLLAWASSHASSSMVHEQNTHTRRGKFGKFMIL